MLASSVTRASFRYAANPRTNIQPFLMLGYISLAITLPFVLPVKQSLSTSTNKQTGTIGLNSFVRIWTIHYSCLTWLTYHLPPSPSTFHFHLAPPPSTIRLVLTQSYDFPLVFLFSCFLAFSKRLKWYHRLWGCPSTDSQTYNRHTYKHTHTLSLSSLLIICLRLTSPHVQDSSNFSFNYIFFNALWFDQWLQYLYLTYTPVYTIFPNWVCTLFPNWVIPLDLR